MIRILHSGIFDSIQDLGRWGYAAWGIAPCGAVDGAAAALANALVGNQAGQALLEMHFPAAELAFGTPVCIALTGADFIARLAADGTDLPRFRPVYLPVHSVLRFARRCAGARIYLAVAGGIEVPAWLGGRGADMAARLPGLLGRPLRRGDVLPLGRDAVSPVPGTGSASWYVARPPALPGNNITTLRFIPAAEWQRLSATVRSSWAERTFRVEPASNRMGLRLAGEPVWPELRHELISGGVTFGTIQLLPDGQLVVLLTDRGATGGYPRLGVVAAADWPQLAQLMAPAAVRFCAVTVGEAEKLYLDTRTQQQRLESSARLAFNHPTIQPSSHQTLRTC